VHAAIEYRNDDADPDGAGFEEGQRVRDGQMGQGVEVAHHRDCAHDTARPQGFRAEYDGAYAEDARCNKRDEKGQGNPDEDDERPMIVFAESVYECCHRGEREGAAEHGEDVFSGFGIDWGGSCWKRGDNT